ncbi:hypothetical protein TcCL_NonESM10711 [Trypanosoma cruzi]|nr:hypothetical protein TcCL_NonESM10711 [Trypanosoma cruzi]
MNALTKLLVPFCLSYRAWRPLEDRCGGMDCRAAEEAVAARDVLRNFSAFQDCCREEDISCLLHVHESKWRDRGCGIALHEGLRSLMASTVRSVCLRPLPKHPAFFLPVNWKIHRHVERVLGDVAARNALMVLQPGSAACNDPAALGVLLAPNFCWLSVGWCRLLEGVLAHAQPSVSPFLCAASQCLGRCGRGRVITAVVTTTLMCYAVAGGATHSSATSCFDVF